MSETVPFGKTVIGSTGGSAEELFVSAWREGAPLPITEFLPREGDEGYLVTLERLVQIEIEQSWRRKSRDASSSPHPLEEYLVRFPALRTPDAIKRLARAEFLIRSELGERPDPQSYVQRFPQHIDGDCASELLAAASSMGPPAPISSDLGMLGDYKLLEQIGEGGMGVVYRALQPGANRVVALKVIRSSLAGAGESFRKKAESRFKNEITAASQLEHENIVPVYDVGHVGDLMYFAMRFVDGKSLSDLVKAGPIENRRAAEYLVGTGKGVAEAHRRGILHRDLKPHNVMVDNRSGRPMVADFGLAKVVDAEDHITKTGEAVGTPSYMPPEQISDASKVDVRGDVYSLGATLYHLLAGRPPFQAANTLGTMRQVLYDEAAPPKRLNSTVDADLDTICLKCLQKEPARRYQSAQEFVEDLERYLRGEPILARPIGPVERLNRWRRRHPLEAGLTAAAIGLAATALVATTVGYVRTKAALEQSDRNLKLAKEAVDELFTEVSEIDLQNQPGLQPLKKKLLKRALAYYQKFLGEHHSDGSINAELAANLARVGAITAEIESNQAAVPHYKKAIEIQKSLVQNEPQNLRLVEAYSDSLNGLAGVQMRLREYGAARAGYDEARRQRQALVDAKPGERSSQRKLANVIMNSGLAKVRTGDSAGAATDYEEAQTIRKTLLEAEIDDAVARDFARGAFNQGTLAFDQEKNIEAATALDAAVEWFERLVKEHPETLRDRLDLAVALGLSGEVRMQLMQDDRAADAYRRGCEELARLSRENPDVLEYRERYARASINAIHLQTIRADEVLMDNPPKSDQGQRLLDDAEQAAIQAMTVLKPVIDSEPERVQPRVDCATLYQLLGDVKRLRKEDDAACEAWKQGLVVLEPARTGADKEPDCERRWEELTERIATFKKP